MKYLVLVGLMVGFALFGAVAAMNVADQLQADSDARFASYEQQLRDQQILAYATRATQEARLGSIQDELDAQELYVHSRITGLGKRTSNHEDEVRARFETVQHQIEQVRTDDFANVIGKVMESVVKIEILDGQGVVLGHGTGFFVEENVVVTNAHVADGSEAKYKVIAADGEVSDGFIWEVSDAYDLALVAVGMERAPMEFTDAYIGQDVAVVGNPLQDGLEFSAAKGIVTNLDRDIDDGAGPIYVQTDASTFPGNSGSPVFDRNGEVVGILTAGPAFEENIGWLIPAQIIVDEFDLS